MAPRSEDVVCCGDLFAIKSAQRVFYARVHTEKELLCSRGILSHLRKNYCPAQRGSPPPSFIFFSKTIRLLSLSSDAF